MLDALLSKRPYKPAFSVEHSLELIEAESGRHFDPALMVALKNVVSQLGQPFQKAVDRVLERLYESAASMPVFVKIDDAMPLDTTYLNRMVKALRDKQHLAFPVPYTHMTLPTRYLV